MTAEEAARVQAALENVDAVMLGYMLRMRAGLAGASAGIAAVGAGIQGLGEALAALKPRTGAGAETTP
ncbi:MAG TPA: hypothetical protein VFT95_09715 [Micromonosporaceae bacterium]|nr:hypothetical protein [Micromonosporaceae bacterium]